MKFGEMSKDEQRVFLKLQDDIDKLSVLNTIPEEERIEFLNDIDDAFTRRTLIMNLHSHEIIGKALGMIEDETERNELKYELETYRETFEGQENQINEPELVNPERTDTTSELEKLLEEHKAKKAEFDELINRNKGDNEKKVEEPNK